MKNRILLFLLPLALAFGATAQNVAPVKYNQLESAPAAGMPLISGTDLKAHYVTSPFPAWTDTVGKLATKFDISGLSGKEVISGLLSGETLTLTKQNGTTVAIGMGSVWIPLSQKGAANGVVPLNAQTKIDQIYLPAQSVSDVFVVASESAMLALSQATQGDFAKRTDVQKMFILKATPASTLSNWEEWYDNSGGVQTVNGVSGPNVTLTTDNVSEGTTNHYFTNPLARGAISATGHISYNNTTGVIGMNTSGVTAGTNLNNFDVDANGIITRASNVAYLTSTDLSNYYTKLNLQTAGQSQVHWDNLTNVPNNIGLEPVTRYYHNSTSSTITLDFTPKFISAFHVEKNGVGMQDVDWSLSGTTLTLGFTRTNDDYITVTGWK